MVSNTNMFGNWWETEIGKEILSKKYFHEGENFDAFVNRVSSIFSPELQSGIKEAIINADFFPAGRSLYGAGSKGKFKASMSNCYIMPAPEDNIESIFEVAKETARIFSYGGGAGINISKLRPKGAKVSNAAKTSTGAVSFMEIYNSVGNVIGANNRRAALILGLNCDHPDIEEFLEIKRNNDKLQSANISILFTDEFMQCVKEDRRYLLSFKVEATGEYITKWINARDFFRKFCEANWDWAEPGCLFIDTIRRHHLLSDYPKEEYQINVSNPCGEYHANSYNACNLGSINLYNMVVNPFTEDAYFDFDKFNNTVKLGVTALDEILDYGRDMQPLEQNKKCIDDWRAIGLGIFGLADMLIAMNIKYGSIQSIHLIEQIMGEMFNTAVKQSARLAGDKGSFGKYDYNKIANSNMWNLLDPEAQRLIKAKGLRNGTLLSIAPTGSISTMAGLSGGVEPLFATHYDRTTHALSGEQKFFRVYAKSVEHMRKIWGEDEDTPLPNYVVTAHDISYKDRIHLQSVMQEYVDNAISSTVNLPNSATVDDVMDAYITAWENGCKGLTIFRDGCKRTAIMVKEHKPQEVHEIKFDTIKPPKRRTIKKVDGSTIKKSTACVPSMYITVNNLDGDIFEVFTNASSGCKSNIATITRLVSLALRSGVKVDEIVQELKTNVCPACSVLKQQGQEVSTSCGASIGEAIEEIYMELKTPIKQNNSGLLECPSCGAKTLRPEGKCFNCSACGYSKCE